MVVLLIAEDDEDIAFVLVRMFKRAGTTVLHASDGQAALNMAVETGPDVILTDLGIPRIDGLQLTRTIRAHPALHDTPIAIHTGSLHRGDPRAAEAAVCCVLLKPCPNDQLLAAVQFLAERGPHDHNTSPSECLATVAGGGTAPA